MWGYIGVFLGGAVVGAVLYHVILTRALENAVGRMFGW